MRAFEYDQHLVRAYERFSRSFASIRAPDIREEVNQQYVGGRFWPDSLLSLNPRYERGKSVEELVASGDLDPATGQVFRINGAPLTFHKHQAQAIAKGCLACTEKAGEKRNGERIGHRGTSGLRGHGDCACYSITSCSAMPAFSHDQLSSPPWSRRGRGRGRAGPELRASLPRPRHVYRRRPTLASAGHTRRGCGVRRAGRCLRRTAGTGAAMSLVAEMRSRAAPLWHVQRVRNLVGERGQLGSHMLVSVVEHS